MMKVKNLKKSYNGVAALKGISFDIEREKITGLLGPNGAGKTTTLRILSGYILPDAGEIEYKDRIIDFSTDFPGEFKKIIGYVPENNPVYEDLEVVEYLQLIARIYSLGEKEIRQAIERCSLEKVAGKKIGTLSKGYKQRVSLAKAIIHNPEILLLDEPTTGLDPNQARNTRELIKELKKDKIVLISSHILSEIEALCENIIIINNGEIKASGKIKDIVDSHSKNRYIVKLQRDREIDFNEIKGFITQSKQVENNEITYMIEFEGNNDYRKEIIDFLKARGVDFIEFYKEKLSLDEVFKKITEV